ncbi:Transmembrane protein [Phytophthora megakarya]|uniref:Transmembrane protein n=1 Tax=Phytophthora megakarya TaxID=4795 RepID=A0A225V1G8_9STRA|nr:Transmembrane protein [Phytophthora megakarya]
MTGNNDKPVTDRLLACVLQSAAPIPATTEYHVDGYRVVRRQETERRGDAYATYAGTCTLMCTTLDMILDTSGNDLGYNVTRDTLRIVVDGEKDSGNTGDTGYLIKGALPVLVMPFWAALLSHVMLSLA